MKISEIIVESKRRQLDEGMMDTLKGKLSSLYQMARKKYPNFDEVFAVAKSHKSEINDIIEQLKAKKESGKLSKEDVVAAIMPLSKKVAADVGGKGVVNEHRDRNSAIASGMIGGGYGGVIVGLISGFLLSMIDVVESPWPIVFSVVLLGAIIGSNISKSQWDTEENRRGGLSPKERNREDLQREYDSLERMYKNRRYDMSYAETRRMEELYNQGFR